MSSFAMYHKNGFIAASSDIMKTPSSKPVARESKIDAGDSRLKFKDDLSLLRHMILNSLRSYSSKYKRQYGSIVICCDSSTYWRKGVFPFYKANRAESREASPFNWVVLHEHFKTIRDELRNHGPYKVLEVAGAEADDIIACLCRHEYEKPTTLENYSADDYDVLIVSADHDFYQLHVYPFVKQYDPKKKRLVTVSDPSKILMEHIIRGDRGDGIPNFLSPDNSLVTKTKQRPIMSKKVEEWLSIGDPVQFCDTEGTLRNYRRNEQLIDFDFIPDEIYKGVVTAFEEATPKPRAKFLDFLIMNRMQQMAHSIGDF